MSRIVSPEEFVDAFHPIVAAREGEIGHLFYCRKDYTALFLDHEGGVLSRTAQSLDLVFWTEFLQVDAAFASSLGEVERFSVAIEHEHDAKTSIWEMNKLAYVDTSLKVLITYPDEEEEPKLLRSYERIVRITQVMNELAQHRRYLAVFAFEEGEAITWRYHVYTVSGFVPLPAPDSRSVAPHA